MRDSTIIGLISGVMGGLIYQIFTWIFKLSGIIDITTLYIGAYISNRPGINVTSFTAQFLGAIMHFAISTLLGLIAVYLLRFMGTDYLWIKGLVYGTSVYLLLYGITARILLPPAVYQPTLTTSVIFMVGHLIFGLVTVHIAGNYLKKSLSN